jgi:hypothetical protein
MRPGLVVPAACAALFAASFAVSSALRADGEAPSGPRAAAADSRPRPLETPPPPTLRGAADLPNLRQPPRRVPVTKRAARPTADVAAAAPAATASPRPEPTAAPTPGQAQAAPPPISTPAPAVSAPAPAPTSAPAPRRAPAPAPAPTPEPAPPSQSVSPDAAPADNQFFDSG